MLHSNKKGFRITYRRGTNVNQSFLTLKKDRNKARERGNSKLPWMSEGLLRGRPLEKW